MSSQRSRNARNPTGSCRSSQTIRRTHRRPNRSSVYPATGDPERLAAYSELAGPAVRAAGGRTLSRGSRVVAHEAGLTQRVVLVEFDSFDQAVAAYQSAAYRAALAALPDGVRRDFRIVEGID